MRDVHFVAYPLSIRSPRGLAGIGETKGNETELWVQEGGHTHRKRVKVCSADHLAFVAALEVCA